VLGGLGRFSTIWGNYVPTRVVFGAGSLEELGKICASFGGSALLVTGGSALRSGVSERCVRLLRGARIEVRGYHSVTPDPTVHQVNEIVTVLREGQFDMLVGVGGGSALDAAKAASVVAVQGGAAEDYLSGERGVGIGSLPVVAVPTTAGTGGELSSGAILTWPERCYKAGIRGSAVFPRAALVDPMLTMTLPAEQTRLSGFDALTHAVETYISRRATPITALLSRAAVKVVCRCLPRVLERPADISARTQLSLYSMLMGVNLANSSTCLPHRLQYPLGALTKTSHALGLAALYPAWLKTTYRRSRARFDRVGKWIAAGLGDEWGGATPDALRATEGFMRRIHLKPTLRDLGVHERMCTQLAMRVDGELRNDPWWREGADLASLYLSALESP
jgi:alcohol dehydrogenase